MNNLLFTAKKLASVLIFRGGILLSISLLSSCSDSNSFEEADLLPPDRQPETVADVVKLESIEELESLSADKIPGDNAGYEIRSLSYECVDTIELRALLLDVTATLESKSPASDSNTRTIKFSAEVGPELVSVEYIPGGEMEPPHDNIFIAFYPKVERYRNYSDGSCIGPDVFYDYGHFPFIDGRTSFGGTSAIIDPLSSFETELIPDAFDIPGGWIVNPEYQYYEDGWFCYHFRDRLSTNINATVKKDDGTSYHGDDFLNLTRIDATDDPLDDLIAERRAQFEKDKYDFYGINEYGYKKYSVAWMASKEEEELFNLCRDVPDVSTKPFPKEEKGLAAGGYYGQFYFDNPDRVDFTSRYFSSWMFTTPPITLSSQNEIPLQYFVIDGRIIHFNDLFDYKFLGHDVSVQRTEYGYLFRHESRFNMYGYNMKMIHEHELAAIAGDHVEYDLRDYSVIDGIDHENADASRSNSPARSRSTAPTIYDSGKNMKIDTTLPESVRNISRARTLNY